MTLETDALFCRSIFATSSDIGVLGRAAGRWDAEAGVGPPPAAGNNISHSGHFREPAPQVCFATSRLEGLVETANPENHVLSCLQTLGGLLPSSFPSRAGESFNALALFPWLCLGAGGGRGGGLCGRSHGGVD